MRIAIKTLNQKTIKVEIEPEKTVFELKIKVFEALGGDFVVERQKLICNGVVMNDEEILGTFNITPDKFIVVMLQRDPVVNNNSQNSSLSSNPSLVRVASVTESLFLTGEDYKQAVDIMVEIGFDRANVEHAMAASFNNPERAFEYLTNGVPENIEAASETSSNTATRINTETVNQVLELLRQNPNLLTATLQQMGVTNAELLAQIHNNPDAFFNLMRQQHEQQTNVETNDATVTPQQLITPTGLEEFRHSVPAATPSQIARQTVEMEAGNAASAAALTDTFRDFSPADHAAIERLKSMGFDELMAIQAYIAFEKNESLTANFLASNVDDQN